MAHCSGLGDNQARETFNGVSGTRVGRSDTRPGQFNNAHGTVSTLSGSRPRSYFRLSPGHCGEPHPPGSSASSGTGGSRSGQLTSKGARSLLSQTSKSLRPTGRPDRSSGSRRHATVSRPTQIASSSQLGQSERRSDRRLHSPTHEGANRTESHMPYPHRILEVVVTDRGHGDHTQGSQLVAANRRAT